MNCTWGRKANAPSDERPKRRPWTFVTVNTIPGAQMGLSPAEETSARHEMLCGCDLCWEALQLRVEEAEALMQWDTRGVQPI